LPMPTTPRGGSERVSTNPRPASQVRPRPARPEAASP
jgi:hypothetical protein